MAGGKEAEGEFKWKGLRGGRSLDRWAGSIPRSEGKAEESDFYSGPSEAVDHGFWGDGGVGPCRGI